MSAPNTVLYRTCGKAVLKTIRNGGAPIVKRTLRTLLTVVDAAFKQRITIRFINAPPCTGARFVTRNTFQVFTRNGCTICNTEA